MLDGRVLVGLGKDMSIRLVFRWIVFLAAAFYCLRMIFFSDWDAFAGPFRFLTVWALFCSFFVASRLIALEEGRSARRWDGFIAMTAVVNTMVVFLYWRLYFADPTSVTRDGELGQFYLEVYLHGIGPALQLYDSLFIHRSHRRPLAAVSWFLGVIAVYILWGEAVLQRLNDTPVGSVTSGLPYPFLNNLELSERMVFYGSNVAIGLVLLAVYAGIAWLIRRSPLPHRAPEGLSGSRDRAA